MNEQEPELERLKPITANLNITLGPVTIAPVTPAEAYYGAAYSLIQGVRLLELAPNVAVPLALLAGQTLECLLKSFLSKHGTSESELKDHTVRHNLAELWVRASGCGLSIPNPPPAWVECLSRLFNKPFFLRYPMGLNALVLPGAQPMCDDLVLLLDSVRTAIR